MQEDQHREIRGHIIKMLIHYYPGEITELTIYKSLTRAGYALSEQDLAREVAFLREEGYLHSEQRTDRIFGRSWTHKALPKAIKLNERTKGVYPDEGITLPDDWM